AACVLSLQILEKPPALADQHQQSPARVMVLRMRLEMLREAVDALGQKRNLDLRGAGVPFVSPELLDQALLAVERKCHREVSSNRLVPETNPQSGFKKTLFCQQIGAKRTTRWVGSKVSGPRAPRGRPPRPGRSEP